MVNLRLRSVNIIYCHFLFIVANYYENDDAIEMLQNSEIVELHDIIFLSVQPN